MITIIALHLTKKQANEVADELKDLDFGLIVQDEKLGEFPLNEILVFIATIVSADGIASIIKKLIDQRKKSFRIELNKDSIRVDCTNATTEEVLELLNKVKAIADSESNNPQNE